MKYGIYSVKDRLIGYNAPFIMMNDEVAKREFVNSVTKNPSKNDLTLEKLAEFDDQTGEITNFAYECMLKGSEIAKED